MKITNSITRYGIVCFSVATAVTASAAPLNEARVSQVIQDVLMLPSNAAARPAAINDKVTQGTALRTGVESRAELTFSDLTITRLGANTVFSFNAGAREIDLTHGSILLQVPSGAAISNIKTAAVTAAVSGGTAMFGTGPPAKFMVLEGVGTFYPTGHPEEAVTLHGGEMVTLTPDGHLQVSTFNVKLVLATSPLITQFPDLANLPLILQVQDQQQTDQSNPSASPPSKDVIDVTSQNVVANPTVTQTSSSPPSEFGPPSTITSPNPYVITSGTTITTDPTITTNGVTDYGKLYRGTALDGTPSQFLFGEAPTSFDQMVFSGAQNNLPIAVFKFADLELAGDPTITVPSGGVTNLALVSVGTITSGPPGGTLTFAGISRLDFITQDGAINLGSEISFSGIDHLTFYARGSGSNLTLASPISGGSVVHLYSEGSTQVNGSISVSDTFAALTGQDFLAGSGMITATNVDIESLNNANVNLSQFPNPADNTGSMILNAINTLNFNLDRGGGFGWSTFDASAETINVTGSNPFDFSNASGDVIFAAGNGGINASGIEFFGHNLTLTSTGDITIGSAITPTVGAQGPHILDGSISASGAFTSSGSVYTGKFNIGTDATVGGQLQARSLTVGNDLTATGSIRVLGGSILVGDNINTQGSLSLAVDENNAFGNITAGESITANGGIFTPGDPCVVLAGKSISAPAVITGTLQAGTDITIDNSNGSFNFGIIANKVIAEGTLTLINVPTITPNNASSTGDDGSTFNDFTMTVGSISSTGPQTPVLSSNGGDANPSFADSNPGNGGKITINITSGGLTIGDGNDLDAIQAKGGAYNPSGPFSGGNGGTVDITVAGDVLIQNRATDHAGITATTGTVSDVTSQYAGAGGTVDITATAGQITVGGNVKVSSDDATQNGATGSGRESASGGTIDLQSNLTTGTGITVTSNGGLFSFLNANAPGPGGSITLSTKGADITVNGTIEADRGTITMDQNDPAGSTPMITIDAATLTSETLNITGAGDVNVGLTNPATINAVTIALSAANNLNWSGGILSATATNSDGNVSISAGQAINITNDLDIERTNNGRTSGLNVTLNAGTDLSVGGNLSLTTDASNIQTGGNIGVTSGGDMTIGGAFTLFISAASGTTTGVGGNINVTSGGSLTAGSLNFDLFFDPSAQVTNGENLTLTVTNDLITTAGGVTLVLSTPVGPDRPPLLNGGNVSMTIGGNLVLASGGDLNLQMINSGIDQVNTGGNISASIGGNLSAHQITASITNFDDGIIGTGGNLTFSVGGNMTASSVTLDIDNSSNGNITTGGNLNLNVGGNVSTQGDATFQIDNSEGGQIGHGAQISITSGSLSVGGSLLAFVNNRDAGSIGSSAQVLVDVAGALSTQGDATIGISNRNDGAGGGIINGDATVNVQANSISVGGFLQSFVATNGGQINGQASLSVNVTGNIQSGTGTLFDIQSDAFNSSGGPLTPATIGSDAVLSVTAANLTSNGFIENDILNNGGGHIHGNAMLTVNPSGDINAQQYILATIADTGFSPNGGVGSPSQIDGNAIVTLQAQNIITSSTATGTPGTDTMALEASIYTNVNGTVGGDAIVNVNAAQQISAPGTTLFWVANGNYQGLGPGTIGGNAEVNVSAADISTGDLYFQILNYGGASIGKSAILNLTATNSFTVNGALNALLDNTGGSIGGNATINMNVGGTATVTNDATFQILGNDPAGSAAINFNGGTYAIGGTLLSTIDQDGTIKFANANVSADTVKVGVFGSNGTLMIGGGSLSANTLMKLYATGSNGAIDFTANVTLTCKAAALILAANTITINDNVVVTITGGFAASVYANIANYSSAFGGNGSTTGTFAGAGASNPQPLGNAPSFGDPPSSSSSTGGSGSKVQNSSITTVASATASSRTKNQSSSSTTVASSSSSVSGASGRGHRSSLTDGLKLSARGATSASATTTSNTIRVADSRQLLSVLDSATPSSNGKIMITSSKGDGVSNNPSPSNPNHPNAAPGLSHDRSAAENPSSSKTSVALLDHTPPSVR